MVTPFFLFCHPVLKIYSRERQHLGQGSPNYGPGPGPSPSRLFTRPAAACRTPVTPTRHCGSGGQQQRAASVGGASGQGHPHWPGGLAAASQMPAALVGGASGWGHSLWPWRCAGAWGVAAVLPPPCPMPTAHCHRVRGGNSNGGGAVVGGWQVGGVQPVQSPAAWGPVN